MKRRHPNIVNISELEPRIESHGDKFGFSGWRMGPEVGAKSIGTSYFEIPAGKQAFPNHYHTANEEAIFVIEGQAQVRIGKDILEVRSGDYICFPVGPEHSHSIHNHTEKILKILCISTLKPVEIVGYPDSRKIGFFATQSATQGFRSGPAPWIRMMIKEQKPVDYYEGE